MSRDVSQKTIQIIYEISLSIRPEGTVEQTVESAVSTYLQKLNCSAVAVFTPRTVPEGESDRGVLTSLPEQYTFTEAIEDTLAELPATEEKLDAKLPIVDTIDGGAQRYVMSLPEFGILLLLKQGPPLPDDIIRSLKDLNEKLATACNRIAIQQQQETQYRELFNEAPVMFAITREVDGKPVIVDYNNRFAEKLGYGGEQLRGKHLGAVFSGESKETLLDRGYDDALEGEFGTQERTLRTKDGKEIMTTMRATPRIDDDGNIVGTRVLFVDIPELERKQVQISVLNRALRHNIRNDLSVIRGRVEMLLNNNADDQHKQLKKVDTKTNELFSTAELARHIQRLIDNPETLEYEVNSLIDELRRRATNEFPEATIEVSTDSDSIRILATNALEQALWELLENACEYAGNSPTVDLSITTQHSTATIAVSDDGPGIPETERQILQGSEETDLKHGTGLGLWLVYWMIETSGGEIQYDCEDGTEVKLILPLEESGQENANLIETRW